MPAVRSEGNLIETIRSAWSAIRGERVLGLSVAGSITYWTIASLLGQNMLVYTKTDLKLSDAKSGDPSCRIWTRSRYWVVFSPENSLARKLSMA